MVDDNKNVSIFDLYTREKLISHIDDSRRKTNILLVKMTQRERTAAFDIYNKVRIEEEGHLREEEKNKQTQSNIINNFNKEQLKNAIIDFEKIQREQFAHLFPFENEEKLTREEKNKKKNELIKTWEKERREALEKEKIEDLRKMVLDNTFESLSIIEAGRKFDFASLYFLCRDPQTKKRIFKDYTEIENVRDKRVQDWLLEELRKFREDEIGTEERAKEEAQSPDFISSGGSQKSSNAPQPLKT